MRGCHFQSRILSCTGKYAVFESRPWRAQGSPVAALGRTITSILQTPIEIRKIIHGDRDSNNGGFALRLVLFFTIAL